MTLCTMHILAKPQFEKPLFLDTNAREYVAGAIFPSLGTDKKEHTNFFYCWILMPAEKNHFVTDTKCIIESRSRSGGRSHAPLICTALESLRGFCNLGGRGDSGCLLRCLATRLSNISSNGCSFIVDR